MKKVSELFERFKNFIPPERVYKNEFIEVVNEEIGLVLKKEEIEIQKTNIRLKISPLTRVKILIKKENILAKLKERLGDRSPKSII